MHAAKQSVYVPQHPGIPVYEGYHGVPAASYVDSAVKAVQSFVSKYSCVSYNVRTLRNGASQHDDISATSHNNVLLVNGQSIRPTKWGFDNVQEGPRVWFFDERTLDELDVIGVSCKESGSRFRDALNRMQ